MKEQQTNQLYRAYNWENGKPIDIIVNESDRRGIQKEMMKYDGLIGSGRWLEFRPLSPVETIVHRLGGRVIHVEGNE